MEEEIMKRKETNYHIEELMFFPCAKCSGTGKPQPADSATSLRLYYEEHLIAAELGLWQRLSNAGVPNKAAAGWILDLCPSIKKKKEMLRAAAAEKEKSHSVPETTDSPAVQSPSVARLDRMEKSFSSEKSD